MSAPDLLEANRAVALDWIREFRRSDAFARLTPLARGELDFAARILARCFTRRWDRAAETRTSLTEMTPDDAHDLLVSQLPRTVSAVDPDALVDAIVAVLVWAAKTSRIGDRAVEYACRKARSGACAGILDEQKWSPGKALVMSAMRAGIDPGDLERVRDHGIASGLDPRFVDEFLPPPPVSLGRGQWLFLDD